MIDMTNKGKLGEAVALLKNLIKQIRQLRKSPVKSEGLTAEQLHYVNEGYRQGLCSAATTIADEIGAITMDGEYLEKEEMWWLQKEFKK